MLVSLLPLQLRQLRFHLRDQYLQLLLTLLARMRIHIPRVLLAVDPCRGVAALKKIVIDLADAARAGLADLAHVGLKINDGRRIRLRRWLVREFCFADAAVDLPRGGVLHIRGCVRAMSSVVAVDTCPSMAESVFTSIPFCSAKVANV